MLKALSVALCSVVLLGTVQAVMLRRRREGKKVSWALLTFAEAAEL